MGNWIHSQSGDASHFGVAGRLECGAILLGLLVSAAHGQLAANQSPLYTGNFESGSGAGSGEVNRKLSRASPVLPASFRRPSPTEQVESRRMRPAVGTVALAFLLASGGAAQIDERCPGTALEAAPRLLSSLNPLKNTARKEGYEVRLVFRLTVTETGSVRDPELDHPPQSADSEKVKAEILKLRFCPAVRQSRYAEIRATFDIQLK